MQMNAAESKLLRDFVKFLVDQEIPAYAMAEEAKLPAAWAPAAQLLTAAVEPMLIAALDKYIDAKLPA